MWEPCEHEFSFADPRVGSSQLPFGLPCVHDLFFATFEMAAKRKRARTPTPGEYLGVRAMQANRRGGGGGRGGGSYSRDGRNMRHSPEYAPYQGGRDSGRDRGRDRSPRYSPYRSHGRDRSASPQYGSYRR